MDEDIDLSCKLTEIRNSEIEYCRSNIGYFVSRYGHIEDRNNPTNVIQRFSLWDAQKKALEDMKENRHVIILKARQLGISWLVLHYAAWMMICSEGKSVIGLSRSEAEAGELIRRMCVIFRNMPSLIEEKTQADRSWKGAVFESTLLKVTITFPSGEKSVMQCFPSNENSARSFTADLLIFDEWAFQQFDRQIWASAFPIINRSMSGQVIGVSTIKRGSLFEELFVGKNDFKKIFIPWSADPSRDDVWYKNTKETLGDQMQAEYPATIEEALTVPGGAFFPEVEDETILTNIPLEGNIVTYVSIDYGLDMLAAYWINRDGYGNSQIVKEHCEPNLTIGAASETILALSRDYEVTLCLAPPDLWNRSQETGKSRAIIFQENGLTLTKVNNDIAAGCSAMKELLRHRNGEKGKLTILNNCAPVLLNCLKKIQHDEKRPNIYANDPHNLTHSPDSLRYYSIYWTVGASNPKNGKNIKWRADMIEDYENATPEVRRLIVETWGEPN